jgi:nucleotide-binding universal stress UspA family protein
MIPQQIAAGLRESAATQLEQWQKRAAQRGLRCTTQLSERPAPAAIVEVANALPAQLIVIGTKGLIHGLLGSVAERVLQLASCSVLTVKLGEAA